MAKDKKKDMTPEEKAKEKERLARIKKEEKELKKRHKEKGKRKKEREKKRKKRENIEKKRIRKILNFPFKTLFFTSSLISMIAFVMMIFGGLVEPLKAIYTSTLIFTFLFLSVGVIMIGGFFVVSQEKISEMKKNKLKESEEEKNRLKKEELELEELLQAEIQVLDREKFRSEASQDPILLEGASEDGLNPDATAPHDENKIEESIEEGPLNLFADNDFSSENESVAVESEGSKEETEEKTNTLNKNDSDLYPNTSEMDTPATDTVGDSKNDAESFFSEDDFMDELVFGSESEKT